ncbi:hypothetical protein C479_07598 [Halovivax asiaticus JCM 14624]|uniref:Uncharacterized protein n=2 Tax=Halovivax asiaticus TaxID=332953 RepID=M0BJX7_9EURY|nr:hypothetical protein C479_07598 [Halovivax asiaticus JCM 14624]
MSHLSQAYQVANGMNLLSTFYPGMPSLVEINREVTNQSARVILMSLGPIFFLVFVVFIGLITRQLTLKSRGLIVGVIIGLMLLPINLVATHLYPHPNSFTILFASIGIFLSITMLRSPDRDKFTSLFVFIIAMIAYHPQHALNMIAVLAVFGISWEFTDRSSPRILRNPLVSVSSVMAVIWTTWVLAQSRFEQSFVSVVKGILSAGQTDVTAGRGDTLAQLGSGIVELTLRLFFIDLLALIFGAVSGIFALAWAARRAGLESSLLRAIPIKKVATDHKTVFCIITTFIPVIAFFGIFLASGVTQQFMRFFGFGMFLASIIIAVGLHQTLELAPREPRSTGAAIVLTIILTTSLVGASLTYHSSPMIFQDTGHVTEASVEGFETQFDYHNGVEMMGTRTPVWRYAVALEPGEESPMLKYTGVFRENPPPDHFANQSLHQRYETDRVLMTTAKGRWLDTTLYDNIRYSSDDYAYLDRQPGIDKTYDNGDVRSYFIHSNDTSMVEEETTSE